MRSGSQWVLRIFQYLNFVLGCDTIESCMYLQEDDVTMPDADYALKAHEVRMFINFQNYCNQHDWPNNYGVFETLSPNRLHRFQTAQRVGVPPLASPGKPKTPPSTPATHALLLTPGSQKTPITGSVQTRSGHR